MLCFNKLSNRHQGIEIMKTAECTCKQGRTFNAFDANKTKSFYENNLSDNRRTKAEILSEYNSYLSQGKSLIKTLSLLKIDAAHQEPLRQEFIDSLIQMYESHSYKSEIEKFPQTYSEYILEDIEIYYSLFKGMPTEEICRYLKSKNILSDSEQLLSKIALLTTLGYTVDSTFSIILQSEQDSEYREIIENRKPHKYLDPAMFNSVFPAFDKIVFSDIADCINHGTALPPLKDLIDREISEW